MIGKLLSWLEDARHWLFGGICPFCEHYAVPCLGHYCGALRGKSTQQIVAIAINTVREVLKDDPADKLVHSALEACDKLDAAFARRSEKEQEVKIELHEIYSSNIWKIGYDHGTETVRVKFKSGVVWDYWPVPSDKYRAMSEAKSVGGYFAREIRSNIKYYAREVVEDLEETA